MPQSSAAGGMVIPDAMGHPTGGEKLGMDVCGQAAGSGVGHWVTMSFNACAVSAWQVMVSTAVATLMKLFAQHPAVFMT